MGLKNGSEMINILSDKEIIQRFQGKKLFKTAANKKSDLTSDGKKLVAILDKQGYSDEKGNSWSDYFGFPFTQFRNWK